MTSLQRSRARAARARAENAAPVIERMQEHDGDFTTEPVVIVQKSRDSWGRPEWLIPLAILLIGILAANTLGYWPFDSRHMELSPADIDRGKRQLLQIDVIRIQSVHESTGKLPENLDEIQPGLDSVLQYKPLEDGRFQLDLIGAQATDNKGGTIYDSTTGEREKPDETP